MISNSLHSHNSTGSSSDWASCRKILVIRPDNMGDLLMSSPAIRALKESFQANITVLTSSMAGGVAEMIPEIDEVITYDLPWIKAKETVSSDDLYDIVSLLKDRQFDAAVIFTVYSQNPLPTAMLAFLAGIPRRLAYCRENPYDLLTHWVPDREPYTVIKHQVSRDLDLVASVGAQTNDDRLSLSANHVPDESLAGKLRQFGVDMSKPYIILHPGVSERKREYPVAGWIECGKELAKEHQLLITGGGAEKALSDEIANGIGANSFSIAGQLNLAAFVTLIRNAALVISVNTGTIHIAAACDTPVIVLYAFTNPQHFPWRSRGKVLIFDADEDLRSKNEVIRYVNERYIPQGKREISAEDIVGEAMLILSGRREPIPELPPPAHSIDRYLPEDQL